MQQKLNNKTKVKIIIISKHCSYIAYLCSYKLQYSYKFLFAIQINKIK